MAALVTATALVIVPVMAIFARRRAGWVFLGTLLAIAPATSRNWVRGGEFVLISSNAAINLFIGNNSSYDAVAAMRPGRDWLALRHASEQYGEKLSASGFFVRRVLSYARTDPLGFSLLQAKKLRLLLGEGARGTVR